MTLSGFYSYANKNLVVASIGSTLLGLVDNPFHAPVGFHSNPAAKAAGASQGLMGAGMGGGM